MERLRGLRGLVQRLGGGDGAEVPIMPMGGREETEEMLENLPLTKAFVERLPRSFITDTAAANDAKAIEALRLINRVDELIESHIAAARDLRAYVSQLSAMTAAIASASTHAHNIHAQLCDLDVLAADLEAVRDADIKEGEDKRFAEYVATRRADLEAKRRGYDVQLGAFQRERVREGLGLGVTVAGREAVGAGLESMVVVSGDAAGLEEFFEEEGEGEEEEEEEEGGEGERLDVVLGGRANVGAAVRGRDSENGSGRGRGKVEVRRGRQRAGVLADEDIEDEEGKKWY